MFKRKAPVRKSIAGVRHLFHGVGVKPFDACKCAAVAAIEGRRFLSEEAPPLPLTDCEIPRLCRCVYVHFSDRRTEGRRDSDHGLPSRYHAADRRSRMRRITDRA